MTILLDTNVFIWSLTDTDKLGKRALADISNNKNQVYISDISLLECAIKIRIGKLRLSIDYSEIDNYLTEANIQQLSFDSWAVENFVNLPELSWSDPFDSAIIAQAVSKHMTLITSDYNILKTKLDGLKVIDAQT
ncbi:MAG TPA: type II toxin-antitoxin system VapC family toxin [Candidatus Saccharimonadales bacterium]|nr:type II toxin-antitoxin system VapC family toxin [Candidatus Saccharimonadales bacterium]